MSVRAYKITNLEHEDIASFNLWHDKELMFLIAPYMKGFAEQQEGVVEMYQDELEEALGRAREFRTIEILTRLIEEAKQAGGVVRYYCF